jgi:uncharacterized protein (DUF4415 family)
MAIQFGKKEPPKPTAPPTKPLDPKPSEETMHVEKRARGRPQSGKETVTLRLNSKVVEHFKPHGKGWKQAIDAYLVKALDL